MNHFDNFINKIMVYFNSRQRIRIYTLATYILQFVEPSNLYKTTIIFVKYMYVYVDVGVRQTSDV